MYAIKNASEYNKDYTHYVKHRETSKMPCETFHGLAEGVRVRKTPRRLFSNLDGVGGPHIQKCFTGGP